MGCCTSCSGTGADASAPETGGRCWDCYGTGHTHVGPCDVAFERHCRWAIYALLAWVVGWAILIASMTVAFHGP